MAVSTPAQPAATLPAGPPAAPTAPKIERYMALDAYRGFIMLMLISTGFGFHSLKDHPVWGGVAHQFDHVEWEGLVFWDLIQPAFMFMVGVAMPFALAIRRQRGATFSDNARHVAVRALKLLVLSQILITATGGGLKLQFINVLAQIAFTYFLTFWILQLRAPWQAVAGAGLLALHSALFFLFPGPEGPFSKEGNIGQVLDQWLLGYHYSGYYVTLNFMSSTVTTLAGAWAGLLLMSAKPAGKKLAWLGGAAAGSFALGLALEPLIPNVKRIWTATFTAYSLGWVLLMLIGFLAVIEGLRWRKWAFPLVVIGMNSIFIYSVSMLLRRTFLQVSGRFFGEFQWAGDLAPVANAVVAVSLMWYLCYWLYQRKIFFKL